MGTLTTSRQKRHVTGAKVDAGSWRIHKESAVPKIGLRRILGFFQGSRSTGTAGRPAADSGLTHPLCQAAGEGDVRTLKRLLDNGVSVKTGPGACAIHAAAQEGQLGAVRLLLERGAGINTLDKAGDTPLHVAAGNFWRRGRQASMVRLLLRREAEVNAANRTGWTSLHLCALAGDAGVAELLLAYRADINAHTTEGWTPLYIATRDRRTEVTALLRRRNAA